MSFSTTNEARGEAPATEATPLLHSSPELETQNNPSVQRYYPAIYIIPVILIGRLAASIPSSTALYIIQQAVCRSFYKNHDPSRIPPDGSMPDELCKAPEVQQQYSALISLIGLVEGIGGIIGYSALSYLSSKYGRKPAILLIVGMGLSSNLCLIISQLLNEYLELVLLALWVVCGAFASLYLLAFLVTTYILDVVDAENRSTFLSTMSGLGVIGSAIAFGSGGVLTSETHNALLVFRTAAVLDFMLILFTFFFLPESFTKEKRQELHRRASEESQNGGEGIFKRLVSTLGSAFRPLKMLKPTYNERTGRRNWRLLYCAMHIFLVEIGGNYTMTITIIYLIAKFSFKTDQTGFFLAFFCLACAFTCTMLIPAIIRAFRPLYKRTSLQQNGDSEDHDTVSKATDHLDVHISVVSWILEIVGFILFSHMTTKPGQYIAIFVASLGAGKAPMFRSIVAASVEPLRQGETIAAVEMIASIGTLISPLYMGAVFSASISTAPSLVFYSNGLIILVGTSILFLIKDSDRYQTHVG